MIIRLNRLRLQNFKAARDFTFEPKGASACVYGANAAGKSTLFDSFTHTLFGKDSLGQAQFEIKTLGPDGEALHGLDHTVELVLDVDGEELALRRTYREKHVRPRGAAHAVFSGHETDHAIDGVPVPKKDYDARVASLCNEDVFRLLTNPRHFNEGLHWTDRRKLLLDVCGDISDEEVIASSEALARLPEVLGKRSLDDHRKVIAARRAEINKILEKLPDRIDEVNRGMPDLPDAKRKELEAELESLREQRTGKEFERARVEAGGEVAEQRKRISEIQGALLDVANKVRGAIDKRLSEVRQKANTLHGQVDAKTREVHQYQGQLADAKTEITRLEDRRNELREEWHEVDARAFDRPHQAENCAVCGQPLPKEQINEAHERAEQEFNKLKANDLERINDEGQKHKAKQTRLEHQVADLEEAIANAQAEHTDLDAKAQEATAELERLQSKVPDVSKNAEHRKLVAEQTEVEAAIRSLEADTAATITGINEAIASVDEQINAVQTDLAKFEQRQQAEARIQELGKQEVTLAHEHEKLAADLHLCEEFVRSKTRLLEDRVNNRFELVRFKLFNQLVNGGIEDCCEVTVNGVPYNSVNNAARIQAGLDVVRALQEHYGLSVPCWVDGREGVSELPEMECQIISLLVSPKDKQLRIELDEREKVAA